MNKEQDLRRAHRRLRLAPRLMRSLRKRIIRVAHGADYFVTSYFGAPYDQRLRGGSPATPHRGYEIEAVRIDDVVAVSGTAIAMKIDIEGFEMQALAGMSRTLRENRGIVQIETTTTRADVVESMTRHEYRQTADFYTDLVFEKH